MVIDYQNEAEKYRPDLIQTLLVGEAPPSRGDTYFYVPKLLSSKLSIEDDASLPATIFHHYFQNRPASIGEYELDLRRLKDMGIFIVDIYDEPIEVRRQRENMKLIIYEIPKLREKLAARDIIIQDENMIFLMARKGYESTISQVFPTARKFYWKEFRLSSS